LLSLACEYQYHSGKSLVVKATHQEIANSVGTVREVIARTLRQFRSEGLIQNTQTGIEIIDPERLIDIFRKHLV
jgi:CRP/FNR family transcriptional regulator